MFYLLLFGRGGWVFNFLLFGRVACFFFYLGGDGSSLTYKPAWLGFKGTNNEKDQTTKNTGSNKNESQPKRMHKPPRPK